MAPEVIRRRQSDHRLDIFSFGVTAYEIYSGQLPWPGGDARAALAHDTPAPDIREVANGITRPARRRHYGLPQTRPR